MSRPRLRVVIPIGLGHEEISARAIRSVEDEIARSDTFNVELAPVNDKEGRGRSWARNHGADGADGWVFFLDADDMMAPGALDRCSFDHDATWGAVKREVQDVRHNVWPLHRLESATGTLSMGFFLRAEVAERFREDLDIGEDFEFYRRITDNYSWLKVREPLAIIGWRTPATKGPRGGRSNRWREEAEAWL